MDRTYREKRIWINLVTQLSVYAVYYCELWQGKVTIGSLAVVVVAIIMLQIVLVIADSRIRRTNCVSQHPPRACRPRRQDWVDSADGECDEGDKYSPSLETAFRVAAVFGVVLEQVIGWG